MNKERRNSIEKAIQYLEAVKIALTKLEAAETEAMENTPESLQDTDRYYAMEEAVDAMSDARDSVDEANEYLLPILE